MHTLKLNIEDRVFDKVIHFLNKFSKSDLVIKEIEEENQEIKESNSLVDFFQSSPLVGELELSRETEVYKDRVEF